METGRISHDGVVESIKNGIATVKIISVAACASCQVNGVCNASDVQEKFVEAVVKKDKHIEIGQWVKIVGTESQGFKALFLGYLLPFILVFVALSVMTSLSMNEIQAGLLSLSVLIPYYLILYLYRDKIKKSFIFEIQ